MDSKENPDVSDSGQLVLIYLSALFQISDQSSQRMDCCHRCNIWINVAPLRHVVDCTARTIAIENKTFCAARLPSNYRNLQR